MICLIVGYKDERDIEYTQLVAIGAWGAGPSFSSTRLGCKLEKNYNPKCLRERWRMHNEPVMDVAHLGHLELLTPKPQESARFFVDVMGMSESGHEGDSVFLRAYDDYER